MIPVPTNNSWRDLQDHRFLGVQYQGFPPADHSWEAPLLKRLYSLEPRLRVLWAQRCYQSKEGSIEKRTCLAFAFHHDGPTASKWNPVSNVLLPVHSNGLGIIYAQPLVSLSVVDGLELEAIEKGCPPESVLSTADRWRQHGRPGRYIPMSVIVPEVEQRAWERRNAICYAYDTGIEQSIVRDINDPLVAADELDTKQRARELAGQKRDDRLQIGKEMGTLDYTFTPPSNAEAA